MHHVEPTWRHHNQDGTITSVVMTDRGHGDFAVSGEPDALEARRRAVVDAPWVWLHQVHGSEVVIANAPGHGAGSRGDAIVTAAVDTPIAVGVADCAPVALAGNGVIGVIHAGWRGLMAGVIEATVDAMRRLGASDITGVLGACIRPDAYEFGPGDLDLVAARLGPTVRATTAAGTPALDVPAAVRAALGAVGVSLAGNVGGCTAAESEMRWSHRARGDRERQALVVWRGEP